MKEYTFSCWAKFAGGEWQAIRRTFKAVDEKDAGRQVQEMMRTLSTENVAEWAYKATLEEVQLPEGVVYTATPRKNTNAWKPKKYAP